MSLSKSQNSSSVLEALPVLPDLLIQDLPQASDNVDAVLLTDDAPHNFNLLRVLAAILVLLSHSFPITGRGTIEPLILLSGDNFSFGSLGVGIFFVISGFLITKSFLNRRSSLQFIINRALRIYPALIVVVLLSTFLAGPLLTTLPLADYLRDQSTWAYLQNASATTIQYYLPGVFESNPLNAGFNGSLWTIPVEIAMYVATVIIGLTLSLAELKLPFAGTKNLFLLPRGRSAVLLLTILLVLCDFHVATHDALSNLQFLWLPTFSTLIPCAAYYAAGATIYLYREKIRIDSRLAVLAAFVLLGSFQTPEARALSYVSLTYLVIFFAYVRSNAGRWWNTKFGKIDLSYGIYLYGCPIQQIVEFFHCKHIGAGRLFFTSLPFVIGCAALSWFLVEKPFLRLKSHRVGLSLPALKNLGRCD